jgi:hypothetical protein
MLSIRALSGMHLQSRMAYPAFWPIRLSGLSGRHDFARQGRLLANWQYEFLIS